MGITLTYASPVKGEGNFKLLWEHNNANLRNLVLVKTNVDEFTSLGTDELLVRLRKAKSELEDLEELSRGILGGTGIHVPFREMKRARHLYEDTGGELRVQIDLIKGILKERGVNL